MITSVMPKRGPKAGGTRSKVISDDLGIGTRQVSVYVINTLTEIKECTNAEVYPSYSLHAELITRYVLFRPWGSEVLQIVLLNKGQQNLLSLAVIIRVLLYVQLWKTSLIWEQNKSVFFFVTFKNYA